MKDFKKINWDGKLVQLFELLIDIMIIVSSYLVSVIFISDYSFRDLFEGNEHTRDMLITSGILVLGIIILFRVYKISITKRGYFSTMFRIIISLIFVTLVSLLASLLNFKYSLPKTALGLMLVMQIGIISIVKAFAYAILRKINVKTCLIFGPKNDVHQLAKKILYDDNKFIYLKYLIYEDGIDLNMERIYDYVDSVHYVYLTENLSSERKNLILAY
jgi:FlaA1/EpsC-like NDP-sugar epimerase